MGKRLVQVSMLVEVITDDSMFTPKFMDEFKESFYRFDTIEDHVKHIAQLFARNLLDSDFVEGYGSLDEMGITARVIDQEEEIER
jgi:hypothetical protein